MTNPTLERAARAAADADAKLSNGPSLYANNPEVYKKIARAVLMAVREPDMDVGLVGAEQVSRNMRGKVKADYCAAKDAFAAMVDKILAEGE